MSKEVKPGVKTTEFWLTSAVVVLAGAGPFLMDVLQVDSVEGLPAWAQTLVKLAGMGVAALTAGGYAKKRAEVKKEAQNADS